jgi:large repetitive protein
MKATLKKSIALASTFAILAINTVSVNAANITTLAVNGGTTLAASTTITTLSFTPVTALTNGSTVTVSYPATVNDTGLVSGDIAVAAAGHTFGAVTVDTANNLLAIPVTTGAAAAAVTLTFSNGTFVGPASGNISFSVITSVGDSGASLIYVAGSNAVNVTATVVPTLSMSLNTLTMALGNLNSSTYQTAAATLTVSTNAIGGATAAMASTGLKSATREIGVTDIHATAQTAATDYYKVSTNGTPVFTDANDALDNAGGTDMLATQNVYTTGAPVSGATTTVTVGSKIDATTEAGNYADTLTFTVTGSF